MATREARLRLSTEVDFTGLTVRPGDTLILATPRRLSYKEFDEMRQQIEERLPGVKFVVLDSASGLAVYKPGDTPAFAEGGVVGIHGGEHGDQFTPEEVLETCGLPPEKPEGSRM